LEAEGSQRQAPRKEREPAVCPADTILSASAMRARKAKAGSGPTPVRVARAATGPVRRGETAAEDTDSPDRPPEGAAATKAHMVKARAVPGTPAGRPAAATGLVARVAGLVRRGAVAMRRRAPAAMGGAITLVVAAEATVHLAAMVLPVVTARQAASANRARRVARGATARQARPATAGTVATPTPVRRLMTTAPPMGNPRRPHAGGI